MERRFFGCVANISERPTGNVILVTGRRAVNSDRPRVRAVTATNELVATERNNCAGRLRQIVCSGLGALELGP